MPSVAALLDDPRLTSLPVSLRLGLLYVTTFVVLGAHLPYWPLWLEDRGMDAGQIGVLLAVFGWTRTVATPWLARAVDRRQAYRAATIGLAVFATLSFSLFEVADGFVPLLLVSVAFGLFYPPLIPLTDSMAIAAERQHERIRYGRLRLWGSLSFLITNLIVGAALDAEDATTEVVRWTILIALGATLLFATAVPSGPRRSESAPAAKRPIHTLLHTPGFVLMALTAGVMQSSHACYYGFSALHWKNAGIGESTIGWLWAEGVIAEIVLFAFAASWLDRFGTVRLIWVAAVAAAIRWSVTAVSTDVTTLAAVQWLHAFSFGATHLAAVRFISKRVPPECAVTAQSLLSAVTTGGLMAGSMWLSGVLFESMEGSTFWVMTGLAAAAALMATGLPKRSVAA